MIESEKLELGFNAPASAAMKSPFMPHWGWLSCLNSNKRLDRALLLAFLIQFVCQFTGCMVGPDFTQPASPNLQLDYLAKQHLASQGSAPLSQWWNTFNDQKLDSLLYRAQKQNPSLRESYERIVAARANVSLSGGQLAPNVDLVSDYSFRKRSANAGTFLGASQDSFNFHNLGLDSSWELDLFGRIRRGIEAADAELAFEEHDFESIRRTLFADIVSSYLNIRLLQSQVTVIEQSLSVQDETSVLVAGRMEAGVSTELDRAQTESFQHRTKALLFSIRQQVEVEFNSLGLLLGQTADQTLREFVGLQPLPTIPVVPEAGFPTDLLRRRPDVMRDEMAVKAASARIGIAEADLYPRISLLGSVSVSAMSVSSLFESDSLAFDVGPNLTWNILHFGRINNNIEIQEARFRESLARYRDTVLKAVRDVEDAMINHKGNFDQHMAFAAAVQADQKSVQLSLQRYQAGKANFQRVLDAQQQLLNDQRDSFTAHAAAITQLVRLFKAAGGGWEFHGGAHGVETQYVPDTLWATTEPQWTTDATMTAGTEWVTEPQWTPEHGTEVLQTPIPSLIEKDPRYPLEHLETSDEEFTLEF